MIEKGVDIDREDKDGFTALIYASVHKYNKIVWILVDNKADVNKASEKGVWNLMNSTLKRVLGGGLSGENKVFEPLLQSIEKIMPHIKGLIGEADTGETTPLLAASMMNNVEGAKLLIKNGAVVDEPNSKGFTPLAVMVLKDAFDYNQPERIEMIRILIDNGADPYRILETEGKSIIDIARDTMRVDLIPNLEGSSEVKTELF